MTFDVKFPIRMKLLMLMGGFALLATLAYLLMAVQVFKDDKVQLIYELNASTVKTLSAKIEADLSKVIDKVKLLTQGHQDAAWEKAVFESEEDLVAYSLYSFSEKRREWSLVSSIRN